MSVALNETLAQARLFLIVALQLVPPSTSAGARRETQTREWSGLRVSLGHAQHPKWTQARIVKAHCSSAPIWLLRRPRSSPKNLSALARLPFYCRPIGGQVLAGTDLQRATIGGHGFLSLYVGLCRDTFTLMYKLGGTITLWSGGPQRGTSMKRVITAVLIASAATLQAAKS